MSLVDMHGCNGKERQGWDSQASDTADWYTMCYANQKGQEEVVESEWERHAYWDTSQNYPG